MDANNLCCRRTYLLCLLTSLTGFALGILAMGLLSAQASQIYMELIKSNYTWEQEMLALQADKQGDYETAIRRYQNIIDATDSKRLHAFTPDRDGWTIGFPFAAVILRELPTHLDPSRLGKQRTLGINYAKLAYFLEKSNHDKIAIEQYRTAAQLLGTDDINKVRLDVQKLIDVDRQILTEKNIHNPDTGQRNRGP